MPSAIDQAWKELLSEPTEEELIKAGWKKPSMIFPSTTPDAARKRCIILRQKHQMEVIKGRLPNGQMAWFFRPVLKKK